MKTLYDNAVDFFEMLSEIKSTNNNEESIEVDCDFILYFILIEVSYLPYNYTLTILKITKCCILLKSGYITIILKSLSGEDFSFDLFEKNFIDYKENGIDLRKVSQENIIIAINKVSAIKIINDFRKINIKDLISDFKIIENHFSHNSEKILES